MFFISTLSPLGIEILTSAFNPAFLSIAFMYPRVIINCFNHSITCFWSLKSGVVTISTKGEPERL